MDFNYSFGKNSPGAPDPDMDVEYGQGAPPLQAMGNLQFLDYIDLIESLWEKSHPEIRFSPTASKAEVYDPDSGYIVYELDSRIPKEGFPKPRPHKAYDDPRDPNGRITIFIQPFINIIRFTSLHQDPRTSEEIMEAFEEFMMEVTPICKALGIEEFLYARRVSDRMEKRFGTDLSARSVLYSITIQKTIPVEQNKLQSVILDIRKGHQKYSEKITEESIVA